MHARSRDWPSLNRFSARILGLAISLISPVSIKLSFIAGRRALQSQINLLVDSRHLVQKLSKSMTPSPAVVVVPESPPSQRSLSQLFAILSGLSPRSWAEDLREIVPFHSIETLVENGDSANILRAHGQFESTTRSHRVHVPCKPLPQRVNHNC